MEDPNNASDPNDIASTSVVAPNVKLLARRKVQQPKAGASPAAAAGTAGTAVAATTPVKVELSDSHDETDSPAPNVAPANTPPAVAAVASTSGVSTRKSVARSATAKRPIINVDAWSSDGEDFAGFEETDSPVFGAQNGARTARAQLLHRSKRIKEEPLSDHEPVEVKQEVKKENDTEEDDPVPASAAPAAALPARRLPKHVNAAPKVSTVAAVAAAIIEQHMISPSTVVTQLNAGPSAAAPIVTTTPTSGGGAKTTSNISDPRYRKPFTFGWKRELVYRAHNDVHRKQYDKAEVYYITPSNKKLRTRADILINLTEGLDANDFTFAREPIGMSAEEEIIRSAKLQTPSSKHRPVNFLDLGEADPTLGFGKRVPKPKMPKGASPPPPSLSVTLLQSTSGLMGKQLGSRNVLASKQMIDMEKIAGKVSKGSKARDEPCTIQCVLAMGTIPQLQCKKCLCLFHPECVLRRAACAPSPNNYVCESCLHEHNSDTGDAITIISSSAASTSSAQSAAGVGAGTGIHSGTGASALAPTASIGSIASGGNAVASIASAEQRNSNKRHNSGNLIEAAAPSGVVNSGEPASNAPASVVAVAAAAAAAPATANGASDAGTSSKATVAGASAATATNTSSVIGAITPWMPATAHLTTNRAELNINSTPPQSIAIVAGRKYIMVPKTNLMSVSPAGDVKIGDNNGIPLQYVDESGGGGGGIVASPASKRNPSLTPNNEAGGNSSSSIAAPTTPATGDDVSPPPKKRLLSRNIFNKTKTPAGSPNNSTSHPAVNHKSSTSTASQAAGFSEIRTNKRGLQQPTATGTKTAANASVSTAAAAAATTIASRTSSSSSVHTLFATDFFNNVSTGYNVLMNTFQYLKVQELLRAACVCRMWNQAAQNSLLWRTVRMKNSQVNDWSGLVSTLQRNGTRHLDLRKMPMPAVASGNADAAWEPFSEHIGRHAELEAIDLCRVPTQVVERLFESNTALRIINSVSIKDGELSLLAIERLQQLQELRLKPLNSMHIDTLQPLQTLHNMRHLSLTSIKDIGHIGIAALGNLVQLETLELGECHDLAAGFGSDVLLRLTRLQRLRLERGTDCCTFEILDAVAQLPALAQLELVNFDIKPAFDVHLQRCTNVKRLLVIPTYISQSATTNHMILNALLNLADNLEQLTWVVTLELLRVTELYVDQCDGKRRDRKLSEDKIPVLKPVPGMTEKELASGQKTVADVPQVEILPLEKVEKILAQHMPDTKFAIIKLPYHATWRQSMTDNQ